MDRNANFDDVMLDQDFDDWQSDADYGDIERETAFDADDPAYNEIVHDSHFRLGELDFARDFDRI